MNSKLKKEKPMTSDDPFFYPVEEDLEFNPALGLTIEASLFAVRSTTRCPRCGQFTPVVTLGFSPEREYLPCQEFKFFTLFGLTMLPPNVARALKKINRNYGFHRDRLTRRRMYLNACTVCRHVFDDDDLRMEPSDPFRPVFGEDYDSLNLIDLGIPVDYQIRWDGDEDDRSIEGIMADCCQPSPDLWQVLVEGQTV
jgi:hypothetical protein